MSQENRDNCMKPKYETLLNRQQVADMLNISVRSVIRLEKQRKIPRVEIGGSIRFRPCSIQSYIEGREIFIQIER